MILSDTTIQKRLEDGSLVITGNPQIEPASVDLRIGNTFLRIDNMETEKLSMTSPVEYKEFTTEKITIPPKSFVLATTQEYLELPNDLAAFIEGRSSIGRMGLFIQNAGWIDPGFKGHFTLQLFNANSVPIEIVAGRRVCQVVFCQLTENSCSVYRGKYYDQKGPAGSRIFKDPENQ